MCSVQIYIHNYGVPASHGSDLLFDVSLFNFQRKIVRIIQPSSVVKGSCTCSKGTDAAALPRAAVTQWQRCHKTSTFVRSFLLSCSRKKVKPRCPRGTTGWASSGLKKLAARTVPALVTVVTTSVVNLIATTRAPLQVHIEGGGWNIVDVCRSLQLT